MDTSEDLVHYVKDGRIDLRGTPGINGEHGLHGAQGEMGLSSSSIASPGLPGANGTAGTHGTPGTPGGTGGSISVVLSRASPGTLSLEFGGRQETSLFPITINANGGDGGYGGNGGNGGQGGHGGNGGWVAGPEQRKFKLTAKEIPEPSVGSSAATGYQAGVPPGTGPSAYSSPSTLPHNSNQVVYLPESSKFVHKTMDNLSCRSKATPNGWNVNGSTVEQISVQDWETKTWMVRIQSDAGRVRFVVSPPPHEKNRSSFTTEALKYLNPLGIRCEVTIRECVAVSEHFASDGGMGGNGGDAGACAPGGQGGTGGSICIASKDASLLIHVLASADGGKSGKSGDHGTPGKGGNGGKGGRDGLSGGMGTSVSSTKPSVPGSEPGSIWYILLGENGEILQRSPRRPTLTITNLQCTLLNGDLEIGWKDKFSVQYTITNNTSIPIPPQITIVPTDLRQTKCLTPALETTDWIQPGECIKPTFEFEAFYDSLDKIHIALLGTFQGTTILDNGAPSLPPLYPKRMVQLFVEDSKIHTKVGDIFKIRLKIINSSNLPVGSEHGTSVTVELTIRDGIKFSDDPHLATPTDDSHWKHDFLSLPRDSHFILEKSCVIPAQEGEKETHSFEAKIYYRDMLASDGNRGRVESIFDPKEAAKAEKEAIEAAKAARVLLLAEKAANRKINNSPSTATPIAVSQESLVSADVLLMIYSGVPARARDNILRVCSDLNLVVAIWNYSTQPEFKLGSSFSSRLIIFFSEDGGLGIFNQPESVLSHFFELDDLIAFRYRKSGPPVIQKISTAPRLRENRLGTDLDSSILFVTPDIKETKKALRLAMSSKLEGVDGRIRSSNKPTDKDIQEFFDSRLLPLLAHEQDFAVFPVLGSEPKPTNGEEWKLEGEIKKSTVSLFQRLFVIGDSTAMDTNNIANLDVAIRTAMTTTQKMAHLASHTHDATPAQQTSFKSTEAALYYDLKSEFFFTQRPMSFFEHVVDLVLFEPDAYTTPFSVESVLRVFFRLLTAAYWRSIGTSPLSPRWYHLESGVTAILKKLGSRVDFNLNVMTENAKAGAKSKDRIKWRRLALPERLREISETNLNKSDC